MGSAASINKKHHCIKCSSKLKYLRYCVNTNCQFYLKDDEIKEHQWNDWITHSLSDGDQVLSQIYPDNFEVEM